MAATHAIMFHHFHDERHPPSQGSLSERDFREMLDWLSDRYNVIGANEYLEKFESRSLAASDICLTFDDALRCQYDIAVPALRDYNLDAFFFVYSSVFFNDLNKLEIFRSFRTNYFANVESFYHQFFTIVEEELSRELLWHFEVCSSLKYLEEFPFYSENDRRFRYLRDQVLGAELYEQLMRKLMANMNVKDSDLAENLWMSDDILRDLKRQGHVVGLHSFDHPTRISALNFEEQRLQYKRNIGHLRDVVGDTVSMSHPCGDYNRETLSILEGLQIKIGFLSRLGEFDFSKKFEVPRNDCANIWSEMKS
ncbi:polysaccharide deacetylase family protein [Alphaproteobacteria bacterium]|nr:polysaccharide deacetylase family protein [Alphaproteobacteria bacterium]